MVTLKDVAKDAGVSIATVSCCLSGSRNVKPETRVRIMDSIEKLKYIPNSSARNLKTADSRRIGVVLTDIDNFYHAEIFKGISAELQSKGYHISVAFSNNSPDIECEKIDDFISSNVSGLLIITSQPGNQEFFLSRMKHYNIPSVFIERRPRGIDSSFAGFDNDRTVCFLTEKLLEKGYRNIALLSGAQHFSSESDALNGYMTALSSCGLPYNPDMVQITNMSKEDAFKAMLNHPYLEQLDAVIATSGTIAAGVLEALSVQGICVPDDVQLLTLGEESWNHASSAPGMIHTERTAFTLGRKAAELLMGHIKSPLLFEEQNVIFSDDIIHRELPLKAPRRRKTAPSSQKPLRILMPDMATAHSAKLLSRNFTLQTQIPVEIDFSPQHHLLKEIITDMERPESRYDIYMYDVPWLEYLVQNGSIANITDFVNGDQFQRSALIEGSLNNCIYESKYYGVPIVSGSQIMFYRKDLFENRAVQKAFKEKYQISLRPPRTWTEFNGIASFFTRSFNPDSPTEFGTSVAGIIDEEFAPEILIRLWAYGGKIWDKYNRVCLNTPENVKALQSILSTIRFTPSGPFETSIKQTVTDFCSGRTAMLVTYTEYANEINSSIRDHIIGRAGYQALPGRSPASVGWILGLSPCTSQPDKAYSFFRWLYQKDISIYMTILDGQSPAVAPYHNHELLKLYPWLELTEESFSYCHKRTGPYSSRSLIIPRNRIEKILCDIVKDIIRNGTSIENALEAAQIEMKALFQSYGYPKPIHLLT